VRSHPIPPNKISYKTRGVKHFEQHDWAIVPEQYRVGKLGQNFATAMALAGCCFSYSDSLCLLLYWCVVTYMPSLQSRQHLLAFGACRPYLETSLLVLTSSESELRSIACSEHAQ
jgi:hypothetical protein